MSSINVDISLKVNNPNPNQLHTLSINLTDVYCTTDVINIINAVFFHAGKHNPLRNDDDDNSTDQD